MILKDEVQILRTREQTNTSLILVAFGRRLGQIHVLVKGGRRFSKKGFEGGFDLLTRGELLAFPRPERGLWLFKEWDEHERPNVGQSYRMLAACSYLCELVEVLTRPQAGAPAENASTEKLFDLLVGSSALLAQKAVNPGVLLLGFTLRALAAEGILPPLDGCEACGKKFPAQLPRGFAVPFGRSGFICAGCCRSQPFIAERSVRMNAAAIHALGATSLQPVAFSVDTAKQLAAALEILVHGALEQNLRTLEYAKKLVVAAGKGR